MSSGIETLDLIQPWIYKRLLNDPQMHALVGDRIVDSLSASALSSPYIVFTMATNTDKLLVGGGRLWVDTVYDIKAVAQGASWTLVQPTAERIEALFGADGEVTQWAVPGGHLEVWRKVVIQYPELIDGVQARHLGAQYNIRAYSD